MTEAGKEALLFKVGEYAVVNDEDYNKWARRLTRNKNGYLYYNSNQQFVDGVNTWISVTAVQHYMLRSDCPDAKATQALSVSYESIQDYVATLRCAASPAASKFWWPSTAIRFQSALNVAMRYTRPGR